MPARDLGDGIERLLNPRPQQPAAHRAFGAVDDAEQAALALLMNHRLGQLERIARLPRQRHKLRRLIDDKLVHMAEMTHHRIFQIAEQITGRKDDFFGFSGFQFVRRFAAGLLQELDGADVGGQPFLNDVPEDVMLADKGGQLVALAEIAADNDLARADGGKLADQLFHFGLAVDDRRFQRPGRDVGKAEADRRILCGFIPIQRGDKIVLAAFEHIGVHNRPRRNAADDAAADNALGLGRVFELFTDGNLIAHRDQTVNIGLGAVIRHAAHRRALVHAAVLARKGDVQKLRRVDGVVEKHFVKIAHAVEQERVAVLLLNFQILAHGGRILTHIDFLSCLIFLRNFYHSAEKNGLPVILRRTARPKATMSSRR